VLRFLVWLIWCCAARWSFHKSDRRSCYASGLYSKAEVGAHYCFNHITLTPVFCQLEGRAGLRRQEPCLLHTK
ncbi:hypothetical protein P692DRAFT_20758137, partial [Suillus brevipes Sb2]